MLLQMSSDCLETSDTLFPTLTSVLQLVLCPALHCLASYRLCTPQQSAQFISPCLLVLIKMSVLLMQTPPVLGGRGVILSSVAPRSLQAFPPVLPQVLDIVRTNVRSALQRIWREPDVDSLHLYRLFNRVFNRMLWSHGQGLWSCFSNSG